MKKIKYCKCGCGEIVTEKTKSYIKNHYIVWNKGLKNPLLAERNRTDKLRNAAKKRMLENNPMKKSEIVQKVSGQNSYLWKGGTSELNKKIRRSIEFKEWRKKVFERDGYLCVICGIKSRKLHPDHIKPFALFEDLRFEVSNGRTLCESCHKKTDTWGLNFHKYNITKENYEKRLEEIKSNPKNKNYKK